MFGDDEANSRFSKIFWTRLQFLQNNFAGKQAASKKTPNSLPKRVQAHVGNLKVYLQH